MSGSRATPQPTRRRAVLWDMDGTLVDSGDLHYEAWRAAMTELGRPLGRAAFDATFGQRNDAVLRQLVDPGISAAEVTRIGDAKEAHYRELVRRRGIALLPGAAAWLARLAESGWLQAIASSGPRLNTETVLDTLALRERFATVVAAEDVTHGKPHPEVFLTAAARLGVTPADCVVVEDAPPGLEAGRRAGMRTIGVLSTHPHLDADRVVAALDQLDAEAFAALLER